LVARAGCASPWEETILNHDLFPFLFGKRRKLFQSYSKVDYREHLILLLHFLQINISFLITSDEAELVRLD
jgi:hypothetical protein